MSKKLVLLMSWLFLSQALYVLPIKSGNAQLNYMLHTEGAHLVNDRGERVHLHGVCKNDFIEDSWGLMGDEAGVIANLDAMKNWGVNFLALGIEVQWWLRNQDDIRENFKTVVELANERGMYVGIGVFGWDYPGESSGGNSAAQEIMANPDDYVDFWLNISNNFKDSPNVLYNSLVEISLDEAEMNEYFSVVIQAIQAIRANGDEHIFMYHEDYCGYPSRFSSPATEGGEMIRKLHAQPLDPDDPTGPRLTNIAYDAHTYRWHGTFGGNPDNFDPDSGQETNSDGVYQREDIMDALEYWGYLKIINEYQVPIIMWEGGAFNSVYPPNTWEKEITCWMNVLSIFNELDVGYGAFWWRAAGPCALIDAELSPTEWGQVLIDAIAARPPDITDVFQIPPKNNVQPEDEVRVNATVTDMSGVKQVTLNYTNGNGTWITVNMTSPDGDVWNATIPAFPYCTNVTYVIIAEDNANNKITTEELGYQYQYQVIPEFPSFLILPLFMMATLLVAIVYRRKHMR